MDPVSAFGLFTGAIQVLQAIASTVGGLRQLTGKLREADLTIHSLVQELTCIRTALTSLKEWLRIHRSGHNGAKMSGLDQDLAVAMDGCRIIMDVLSEEVFDLVQSAHSNGGIGFGTRMKIVWNDEAMRGHQEKLHAQVQALQLLLQATTRQIIGKVADDTATLKTGRASRIGDADNISESSSRRPISDRIFDFDAAIIDSPVYQRALNQWNAPSLPPDTRPQQSEPSINISQTSFTDEGYGSYLSENINNSISSSWTTPTQVHGHLLAVPNSPAGPVHPGHNRSISQTQVSQRTQPGNARRSVSDSKVSRLQSSGSRLERLSSFLGRMNTSSRISLRVPAGNSQFVSTSSFARRTNRFRPNFHISIDLSKYGASVPPLVKAAQVGSRDEVERLLIQGDNVEERHEESGRNALLVASHCGRKEVVDLLIHCGAQLTVTDGSGETALHLAASRGHWETMELLLVESSLLDTPNLKGRTALRVAADCGQPEAVQVLLIHHAQVNARAENQMTAFHAAAKRGDAEILQLLLSNGADLEAKDGMMMTALHYSCEEGHLDAIGLLLKFKGNIEAPGRDRKTPLICAAEKGQTKAVQLLLQQRASSRSVDDTGMTALHWAAYNGHEETVRVLSERKGALETVNSVGRTALHLAVMQSQFAVVELLQRMGIPLERRCKTGLTALHYACIAESFDITRLLILTGADIEAVESQHQQRPLHIAATRGSIFILDALCDKGASLDARNGVGDRPISVASRFGNAEIVQRLLDRGSPLSLKFGDGPREDSPLCLAAMGGHWHVVSLLIMNGASILKQDEAGWSPIRYAVYHGHPDVLQLLLSSGKIPDTIIPDLLRMPEIVGFSHGIPEDRKHQVQSVLQQNLHQNHPIAPPSSFGASHQESPRISMIENSSSVSQSVSFAVEADSSTPFELPGSLDQVPPNTNNGPISPRSDVSIPRQTDDRNVLYASDRVTKLQNEARGISKATPSNKRRVRSRSRSISRNRESPLLSATFMPVTSSSFIMPQANLSSTQTRSLAYRTKSGTLNRLSLSNSNSDLSEVDRIPRTLPMQRSSSHRAESRTRAEMQKDDESDSDSISSVYTAPEGGIIYLTLLQVVQASNIETLPKVFCDVYNGNHLLENIYPNKSQKQ
ncbi:hypothetical protein N7462_008839 [Penicillium macrosclerotiorum]|uniref:uncharacterized protein n=1 Tax=Penicillium macrosclerotiorum TaxID=303699 RepID=UPI00254758AD|nr:uncharacterized protein N7462_008839 [Penicillium macrosclerotiorum]KAJ5675942.1 hypothetical protein N7462_008839 [Penicillium macrosclerotiorum]